MNKAPIDYDPKSLGERSRETAGIRGERFSRVAAKIAQGGTIGELRDGLREAGQKEGWLGFGPMDKRIVSEVVEGGRAKKRAVAERINKLKSSTVVSVTGFLDQQDPLDTKESLKKRFVYAPIFETYGTDEISIVQTRVFEEIDKSGDSSGEVQVNGVSYSWSVNGEVIEISPLR